MLGACTRWDQTMTDTLLSVLGWVLLGHGVCGYVFGEVTDEDGLEA